MCKPADFCFSLGFIELIPTFYPSEPPLSSSSNPPSSTNFLPPHYIYTDPRLDNPGVFCCFCRILEISPQNDLHPSNHTLTIKPTPKARVRDNEREAESMTWFCLSAGGVRARAKAEPVFHVEFVFVTGLMKELKELKPWEHFILLLCVLMFFFGFLFFNNFDENGGRSGCD